MRCARRSATAEAAIAWIFAIERGLMVDADRDQLLRVLINLARNAVQALESVRPTNLRATRSASPGGARAPSS